MTPTFRSVFPYLLVIIIDFYILPLLIRDTGSAMIMLLIILPFICFVSSVFYGIRHSFHLSYAFIVATAAPYHQEGTTEMAEIKHVDRGQQRTIERGPYDKSICSIQFIAAHP